ncbi:hypothetical protein JWZ98_03215 [Methylomonas sp. EFPC1]|uniref:hypothetical protein n=1 Tax=Methylomonas sp. EFPC1 TaxID=2812647 RepID=UPI00196778EB|nr:hypothetical protein [Methylomonas sp. EFPC1]QSB01985.1 hypothetical protein JWZ98_03215 [Methylomonas sp. EFPC1]
MSAHYSHGTGTIRFYPEGKSYANRDDFDGVVSVKWLDDKTALLEAALGNEGGKRLKAAIEQLIPYGAQRIRMKRAKGHRAPKAWKIIETDDLENTWELVL